MSYLDSNYYDCNKNDDIGLEPRLFEYVKKRQFFKENGIDTSLLEKEFALTKTDIVKIKAYVKGDKEKYSNGHQDMIDYSQARFPSDEFKKDIRLERIKAKQKKEADANDQRHDYGMISKTYDMYREDRPFASASGNDFTKSDFHPTDWFKNSRDEIAELDTNSSNGGFFENNTYVNPRSSYNGYLDSHTTVKSDNHTIDDIIGKLDTYTKQSEKIPRRENSMDVDYKRMIPANNNNNLRCTENTYKPMPFMGADGSTSHNLGSSIRDMDVDSHMRFGETPMRAGKSLGYPSVLEHAFSYISQDIQDPNHVVMDRGVPSRAFNKETARPTSRRDPMR